MLWTRRDDSSIDPPFWRFDGVLPERSCRKLVDSAENDPGLSSRPAKSSGVKVE
jgi:hypothetical protein